MCGCGVRVEGILGSANVLVLNTIRLRLAVRSERSLDTAAVPAIPFHYSCASLHQELKDARKVMPATMGMSTIPLPAGGAGTGASATSALAVAGGSNGGDGSSIVARALAAPGAGPVGARGGEAESMPAVAATAAEGHNGDGLSHVEKLEIRAAEIMEQVLRLASFCERAGASKELEVSVFEVKHELITSTGRLVFWKNNRGTCLLLCCTSGCVK